MRRGTNPIITIKLNIDISLIDECYVTFKQKNVEIEKTVSDCSFENGCICVQLTQEETLSFVTKYPVLVQARMKLSDGTICATDINKLVVGEIIKDGEI